MNDIFEETQKAGDKAYSALVRPDDNAGTLRDLMALHITKLVSDHNADLSARIAFVNSGEKSPIIEPVLPYISHLLGSSPNERAKAIACWEQAQIVCPVLDGLTDKEFLEAYNRTLLTLRAHQLPDTSC